MRLRRILAATDFSDTAELALQRAARLASSGSAELELIHAQYLPPLAQAWQGLVDGDGFSSARLGRVAGERLRQSASALQRRSGICPETRVLNGKPAPELAGWARASGADLIVVGAHGEHLILDLFVGSTAIKLLRLSSTPVLLVRKAPDFPYRRVVVATDFSPAAQAAADLVAHMLPEAGLELFHAFEIPFEREMNLAGASVGTMEHYRLIAHAEAKRQMQECIGKLADPARWSATLRQGYPPAEIIRHAGESTADLLVLGCRRRSEIEAAMLGSVAAHLVNESPLDLLLVPAEDD